MALVVQTYTFAQQYAMSWLHAVPKKNLGALKLGVLSTATINAAASKWSRLHSLLLSTRC